MTALKTRKLEFFHKNEELGMVNGGDSGNWHSQVGMGWGGMMLSYCTR